MAYINEVKTPIEIEREDEEYVYFSRPARTRVKKSTGELEVRNIVGKDLTDWQPAKLFKSITSNSKRVKIDSQYQLRFTRGRVTFAAARVIATALVPNPDKKEYVMLINHDPSDISPSNLKWTDRCGYRQHSIKAAPFTPEEQAIVDSIPYPHDSKNKEYMKFLNNRKDEFGMTKAKRYALKKQGKLAEAREFARKKAPYDHRVIDIEKNSIIDEEV